MFPTKRALLVASPFGNLRGPLRDVENMTETLRMNGFAEITKCVGTQATRAGVLKKWAEFVLSTGADDAIVFYYSGHGALIKPNSKTKANHLISQSLQFIVPMDYDKSNIGDFRGILDIEISHFLWQITKKTKNITVILDCCHAGRMARNPKLGSRSSPRFLPGIQYHEIDSILRKFSSEHPHDSEGHPEGNPFTVRIVAGTQGETAWEYEDSEQNWQGAFTRALGVALAEAAGKSVSWHTTMIRVRDMLAMSSCPQYPNAEGPSRRIHFSLDESDPGVFGFHLEGRTANIDGGKITGFYKNDVFALLEYGSESQALWLAKAKLSCVDVFDSRGDIVETQTGRRVPEKGVAILIKRALRPSPIHIPSNASTIQKAIESSRFLRASAHAELGRAPCLRLQTDIVTLYDEDDIEICHGPTEDIRNLCKAAEKLVGAKLLRNLKPEPFEKLAHELDIRFDIVKAGKRKTISPSGKTHVIENDKACIWLENKGRGSLYVNIFDVNIAGKIMLINTDSKSGVELEGKSSYMYGKNRKGEAEGQSISWPKGVPTCEAIGESLFFIVTDHKIDLMHVVSPELVSKRANLGSTLEDLTCQIASGGARDFGSIQRTSTIHFDTVEIPFVMHPAASSARSLPDPQECDEWSQTLQTWPELGNGAAKVYSLPPLSSSWSS